MARSGLRVVAPPLVWALVLFVLAAPFALGNHAAHAAQAAQPTRAAVASVQVEAALDAPRADMEDDTEDGSPGVLGLPPKVHLIVNRTGTGTAPTAPVLAVLPAPADRTDAGVRLAADQAGDPRTDAPPANSRWGRAPPRALA